MSEIMRPIPFDRLVGWVLDEYRQRGTVFGLAKDKFYRSDGNTKIQLFGQGLGSAVGPAAGPHSQLAQNIVTAYLAGGRFIELKTVQTMDGEELRKCIARPCINAQDEGYNVEWSTELTVGEAMAEYVKAWFLLHVLMKELRLSEASDFVFNMSVGYSLEGIQSAKIDGFIEGLKNASGTEVWQECVGFLEQNLGLFSRFSKADLDGISPAVAQSVTLSTLHGCPKEEIERIAAYLLTEKGVHTYIKCNPTLLGYTFARGLLDQMGYGYLAFDTHHFENDLQFGDAVEMFGRLFALAQKQGLTFGLKLTNTFPVQIKRAELPGEEMYMSGRALYPLTISLAAKLAETFGGRLPLSFSGGADYFNAEALLQTGVGPVTVATTLLKPGGYARLGQLAGFAVGGSSATGGVIDCDALSRLAGAVSENARHRKDYREVGSGSSAGSRKIPAVLGPYDCAVAPCSVGCPINQQIPAYMQRAAEQDYAGAYGVIIRDNAVPAITGAICDHQCQSKCTRIDYDDSLRIRAMKQLAVENAADEVIAGITTLPLKTAKKAVVIGGGPAGMAAALYLRRNGMSATVMEKRARPYGIVSYVIPGFRVSQEAIDRDLALAEKNGVEVQYNCGGQYELSALQTEYDYVVLATGAWGRSRCGLEYGEEKLLDALDFLADAKNGKIPAGRIAVIGGGDVAMDCARAAIHGGAKATVVYRRTKEYMPAQREELALAEADDAAFLELLAPVGYDGEQLVCEVMALGAIGADGRRRVTPTGERKTLLFDAVVSATGATVETDDFLRNGLTLTPKGLPEHNEHNETSIANVFVAGDCVSGPATVVRAMADAKRVAQAILAREGLTNDFVPVETGFEKSALYGRKGVLKPAEEGCTEATRCLACNVVCELCADVCPNRANIAVGGQILHIDGMCNECGNCAVFCPYEKSAPYRDKITLFWTEEDFKSSTNAGFIRTAADTYRVRREDGSVVAYTGNEQAGDGISGGLRVLIENTPGWCFVPINRN